MTKYEIPIESKKKKSARIPIDKLHDFDGHPYKVTDNEDMDKLVESIKSQGIISPLIVRLKDNFTDEYEVISGHRRLHASKRAGLTEVPALIYPYLTEQEQYDLMNIIESNDCTPSLSQAQRLKKLSQAGQLNADKIFAIMSEEKANQKERISFPYEDIRRFFPKSYTQKDVYNAILKLIGDDYMRRERARKNRDER